MPSNSTKNSLIIGVLMLILSGWWLDSSKQFNTTSRVLTSLNFWTTGEWNIDQFHEKTGDKAFVNNHYYSEKPPLPAYVTGLIMKMVFWNPPTTQNQWKDRLPVYLIGDLLFSALPFTLIILICCGPNISNPGNNRIPAIVAAFFGSYIFCYSGAFFSHLFAALLLLLAYRSFKSQNFFLSALWLSIGINSEYILILTIPVFITFIGLEKKWGQLSSYIYGLVPGLGALLFYNSYFTGSPFTFLYHFSADPEYLVSNSSLGLQNFNFEALFSMVFSLDKGLIWMCPAFLPLIWINKSQKLKLFYTIPFASLLVILIFLSFHAIWYGGSSIGVRHLIPFMVLVLYELFQNKNIKFPWYYFAFTLIGVGVFTFSKSVLFYFNNEMATEHFFYQVIEGIKFELYNNHNIMSLLFVVEGKYSVILWWVLFSVMFLVLLLKNNKKAIS